MTEHASAGSTGFFNCNFATGVFGSNAVLNPPTPTSRAGKPLFDLCKRQNDVTDYGWAVGLVVTPVIPFSQFASTTGVLGVTQEEALRQSSGVWWGTNTTKVLDKVGHDPEHWTSCPACKGPTIHITPGYRECGRCNLTVYCTPQPPENPIF